MPNNLPCLNARTSLSITLHTDKTLREFVLDAASEGGLHELARIPFDGNPVNVLADDERAAILVEDYNTNETTTRGVYLCRQVATGWQRKQVTLTLDKDISIRFWSRLDETHVAIVDDKSGNVLILEYV